MKNNYYNVTTVTGKSIIEREVNKYGLSKQIQFIYSHDSKQLYRW